MSVEEEVKRILRSGGRVDKVEADLTPDDRIHNVTMAVRELQDAVVYLGEQLDAVIAAE